MVAEPQEPLEQAQQEERREAPAQGTVHHSTEQQTEVKPRCMSYYLKFMTHYIYVYVLLVHYV